MSISAYNTLETARATAATLGLAKVTAATDEKLTAALELACIDLDSAMRYQGRKYDLTQEREFPRVDGTRIWDLASDGVTVIVPAAVKTAEVLQAESLLASERTDRLQAIADGVVSQSIGNQSESYRQDVKPAALCERPMRLLSRYRLRCGELL